MSRVRRDFPVAFQCNWNFYWLSNSNRIFFISTTCCFRTCLICRCFKIHSRHLDFWCWACFSVLVESPLRKHANTCTRTRRPCDACWSASQHRPPEPQYRRWRGSFRLTDSEKEQLHSSVLFSRSGLLNGCWIMPGVSLVDWEIWRLRSRARSVANNTLTDSLVNWHKTTQTKHCY